MSVCTCIGLSPAPKVNLVSLKVQIESSISQPIRSESNDVMSGWVPYWMLDITTPPHPVLVLLLANLLGYRGPTIVKCSLSRAKHMGLGPGEALEGTTASGGGAPSLAKPLKKPWALCKVRRGRLDSKEYILHLCHALGTSHIWAHTLIHTLPRGMDSNHTLPRGTDSNPTIGAQLDHPNSGPTRGVNRGMYLQYSSTVLVVCLSS